MTKSFAKYLNEKEVAEITDLSVATLRNDRFLGRGIPYVKFGRAVRYSYQDVIKFMESHKVKTKEKNGNRYEIELFI
jgi:predicted DNA-binding transcriptional regulator AlpA